MTASARHVKRLAPDRNLRLAKWGAQLEKWMTAKDMDQSELARRAAVHKKGKAFGRDLISNYVHGKSEPSAINQAAIAKALGMTVEELMAPITTGIVEDQSPPINMHTLPDGRAHIDISADVPMDVAIQVFSLLAPPKK
jgi:transcriptional regulator with XRE-family HTH domain